MTDHVRSYDFRRPDHITKNELHTLHLLHENFARNLAASLSAYLRACVAVNLISVEQVSFEDFTHSLPSPTCLISLGLNPFDGKGVLEISPSLVFPCLEMLLGGSGKVATKLSREITEIEQSILDGLLRIILQDLRGAWGAVTGIDFSIESHETEPLQIMATDEAVVAIRMEMRIGDAAGRMNLGIPSVIIKTHRPPRKPKPAEDEHARMLRLIQPALMQLDARLQGPKINAGALLDLKEGDVLVLDHPVEKPVDITVNGRLKYQGEIVVAGGKLAFEMGQPVVER